MIIETEEQTTLVNLTINGKAVAVPRGTTVYHAVTDLGFELPVFCYQDRMPPFGACRVCLVEVEKMGKLQTSCTLEVAEGMVVHTQSQLAVQGREDILEFLLINHPLDCPICDKGGECPLQDQTIKFGPARSNFYEEKRRFPKHHALGPLLMLDRERCIVCARCTRFGDLIAGDHALEFIERGFKTEVGTPGGKPVDSKFIGNTIMICPVGALTSDVYRFKARPWDNNHVLSTCTLCPVGCSMILDQRDGEIVRTRSSENREVNDIWMCDKGWFGYEYASYKARLQKPLVRKNGQLEIAGWEEALSLVAAKFREAKPSGRLAGWGGNPLTTEENYLFQKLFREGGAVNNLDHRIGMPSFTLHEEGIAAGMEMDIGECESLSHVLVLGVDITEEFPVIWLRLKQGINHGAKVTFAGHFAPEVACHLHKVILHPPGSEINTLKSLLHEFSEQAKHEPGTIFIGRQYLSTRDRLAILSELVRFQETHPGVSLNLLEGRGNSIGARVAGMHPEMGPFGNKLESPGLSAVDVLKTAASDRWDFLYVAGADPAKKFPSKLWKEARSRLGFLVVQDIFLTDTARQADVVLPSLCSFEKEGSFINIAHRIQFLHAGRKSPEGIYSDYDIFTRINEMAGVPLSDRGASGFYTSSKPTRGSLPRVEPDSQLRHQENSLFATFSPALFDNGMRMKHNPHLLKVVKEPRIGLHPKEADKRGIASGATVMVKSKEGSVSGIVMVNKKFSEGTVVLPLGFDELPVHDLSINLLNGLEVEVIV